eukprot:3260305-Rhodomonas_salina.1
MDAFANVAKPLEDGFANVAKPLEVSHAPYTPYPPYPPGESNTSVVQPLEVEFGSKTKTRVEKAIESMQAEGLTANKVHWYARAQIKDILAQSPYKV